MFAASAVLKPRNLYSRVEIAFPLESKSIRQRVITDLNNYLKDNTQAWIMKSDGTYEQSSPGDKEPYSVQGDLLSNLAET